MIKDLIPFLPEVGKIKIGRKSGTEKTSAKGIKWRPPEKIDYFLITTTERDKAGNLVPKNEIMDKIGEVRELRIRLPFDDPDKNFFTCYAYYASKTRICQGDGEKAVFTATKDGKITMNFLDGTREIEIKTGDRIEKKCLGKNCQLYKDGKCKISGNLSVFLPDSLDLGGIYRFRTHSFNSVNAITASLQLYHQKTGGILQGLPLKLQMVKKTTEEYGNIDFVTVVIDGKELSDLQKAALSEKKMRALLNENIKQIEEQAAKSGFFVDTDPEDAVREEFYPENEVDETPIIELEKTGAEQALLDLEKNEKKPLADKQPKGEQKPRDIF